MNERMEEAKRERKERKRRSEQTTRSFDFSLHFEKKKTQPIFLFTSKWQKSSKGRNSSISLYFHSLRGGVLNVSSNVHLSLLN